MSEISSLTLGSWLSKGWSTYKRSMNQLIGASIILSAFSLVVGLPALVPGGILITVVGQLVIAPALIVGWCFLCLRLVRGVDTKTSVVFAGFSNFGAAWVTFFLFFLIVLGGFLLLVIPGIIWVLKYGLCLFAVMDKKLTASKAIQLSGRITKGHKGKLFGIYLISSLLSILMLPFSFGLQSTFLGQDIGSTLIVAGFVPYLVGVFVITPWIGASFAAAYDSLALQEESIANPNTY